MTEVRQRNPPAIPPYQSILTPCDCSQLSSRRYFHTARTSSIPCKSDTSPSPSAGSPSCNCQCVGVFCRGSRCRPSRPCRSLCARTRPLRLGGYSSGTLSCNRRACWVWSSTTCCSPRGVQRLGKASLECRRRRYSPPRRSIWAASVRRLRRRGVLAGSDSPSSSRASMVALLRRGYHKRRRRLRAKENVRLFLKIRDFV